MKRIIALVVIVIVAIFASGMGKELGNIMSNKLNLTPSPANATSSALQQHIDDFARTANETFNLPKRIDSETVLTAVSARQGELVYHYKCTNFNYRDMDMQTFKKNGRKLVKSSICTSKKMEYGLKKGIAYTYSYVDKNGHFLAEFTYTKHDCGY